jgi:hypothetical protein
MLERCHRYADPPLRCLHAHLLWRKAIVVERRRRVIVEEAAILPERGGGEPG